MPDRPTEHDVRGVPAGVDRNRAWAEVRSKVAFLAGGDIAAVTDRARAWWVSPAGALHSSASPDRSSRIAPNDP